MSISLLLSSIVASSKQPSVAEEPGLAVTGGESNGFAALLTEQMNSAIFDQRSAPPLASSVIPAQSKSQLAKVRESDLVSDFGLNFSPTENFVAHGNITDIRSNQELTAHFEEGPMSMRTALAIRSNQGSTAHFEPAPSTQAWSNLSPIETIVIQGNGLSPRSQQPQLDADKNDVTTWPATTGSSTRIIDAHSDHRSLRYTSPSLFSDTRSVASDSPSNLPLSETMLPYSQGANPDRGSPDDKSPSHQAKHDPISNIDSTLVPPSNSVSQLPDTLTTTQGSGATNNTQFESRPATYSPVESQTPDLNLTAQSTQPRGELARKPSAANDRTTANETAKSVIGVVTPEVQLHKMQSPQGQLTPQPFNTTSRSNQHATHTQEFATSRTAETTAKAQSFIQPDGDLPVEKSALNPYTSLTIRTSTPQEPAKAIGATGITSKVLSSPEPANSAALISMKGNQLELPENPFGNNEPAKPAGETLPPLPANTAAPTDRAQSTARTDSPHNIAIQLSDPRWSQQLGERVVWLARGDIQNAQININPAQLGPIQINISLNGDQMSAHFVAAHQEVRQALEDAMPRLRDMLSGAGINLGQANVGAQTQQQQQRENFAHFGDRPRSTSEDAILSPDHHTASNMVGRPVLQGKGLVDLFA